MATFVSKSPQLRLITSHRRVVKFRGGKFSTDDESLAEQVREYASEHPARGIMQIGGSEPIPEETVNQADEDEFDAMSVEELKDALRERDLKVTGNRSRLLARLRGEEEEE